MLDKVQRLAQALVPRMVLDTDETQKRALKHSALIIPNKGRTLCPARRSGQAEQEPHSAPPCGRRRAVRWATHHGPRARAAQMCSWSTQEKGPAGTEPQSSAARLQGTEQLVPHGQCHSESNHCLVTTGRSLSITRPAQRSSGECGITQRAREGLCRGSPGEQIVWCKGRTPAQSFSRTGEAGVTLQEQNETWRTQRRRKSSRSST